jgi:hypothetical protein
LLLQDRHLMQSIDKKSVSFPAHAANLALSGGDGVGSGGTGKQPRKLLGTQDLLTQATSRTLLISGWGKNSAGYVKSAQQDTAKIHSVP